MFRITKQEGRTRSVLTVEGNLSSDSVETVETCCRQAMSRGRPVDLLLSDVTNIDSAGRDLLGRLAAGGIRLRGAGVYTSYLVRGLRTAQPRTAERGGA